MRAVAASTSMEQGSAAATCTPDFHAFCRSQGELQCSTHRAQANTHHIIDIVEAIKRAHEISWHCSVCDHALERSDLRDQLAKLQEAIRHHPDTQDKAKPI